MLFRRTRRGDDRVQALEERIVHLESMIEGLQDAVHRNSVRTDSRLEDLRKQLAPDVLSRTLSDEQRRRGT